MISQCIILCNLQPRQRNSFSACRRQGLRGDDKRSARSSDTISDLLQPLFFSGIFKVQTAV